METLTPEQIYALPTNVPKRKHKVAVAGIIIIFFSLFMTFGGEDSLWIVFFLGTIGLIMVISDYMKDGKLQSATNIKPPYDINLLFQPIKDAPLQIAEDEGVYLYCPMAEYSMLKSVGRSYGGFSARVVKGLWIHSGRSAPTPKQISKEDIGKLFLTNKRIVFAGVAKNIEIQISKITTYEDTIDNHLLVTFGGRVNAVIFKPTGQKAFVWTGGIKRVLQQHQEETQKKEEMKKLSQVPHERKEAKEDVLAKIEKLASLKERHIITEVEFETKKKELLDKV